MSQQHPINDFTNSMFAGLRSLVDSNTVIGTPIDAGFGTTIIPVSRVNFGYGSGGTDLPVQKPDVFGGGTGGGATITPVAFLVIKDGNVELLQMQSADNTADRVVNAVPGIIDKFVDTFSKKKAGSADA